MNISFQVECVDKGEDFKEAFKRECNKKQDVI